MAEAGPDPEVVVEATYGWYWVVDLLQANGARVHLANPPGLNWGQRRVKNDERDAIDLADMLRLGRLPEAWIAPPATRELRELVRYRAKLVALRTGLKAQVHAVMAKEGVLPAQGRMFGPAGNAQLDAIEMADSYTTRVESLRDLIERLRPGGGHARGPDPPPAAGPPRATGPSRPSTAWGPTIAAILVAEIGDVEPVPLGRGAVLVGGAHPQAPRVRHQGAAGRITKQGSKLVRWAVIEAVSRYHGGPKLAG